MFELIATAPIDPILGLTDLFRADNHFNKINLSIGVYKDETGKTPVLKSVKKAEQYLLESEITKNYLDIDGISSFNRYTQELLFGKEHFLIKSNRIRTTQTPGGTGALRIAADFLSNQNIAKRIWISNPTWPNHKNIFSASGLEVHEYEYYDFVNHTLNFEKMLLSLKNVKTGDVVLFHACCHNPTGIDPTNSQWKELARISELNGWLPLFDFAYQGFSQGINEDAEVLRIFSESNQELMVASSYSKNFSLYNERVGAFTLVASNSSIADTALSQVKNTIRSNYSNPPSHGASVVSTILEKNDLRKLWENELFQMRKRIQDMREILVKTLEEKNIKYDFSFIKNQNGMFSFSGLSKSQVMNLRNKFGIYAVNSGRINIAGITLSNISTLCNAIIAVL